MERTIIQILAILNVIFLLIVLVYYPPSYAIQPAVFLVGFITAIFLLPQKTHPHTLLEKIILGILILGAIGIFFTLAILWKVGPFWRVH